MCHRKEVETKPPREAEGGERVGGVMKLAGAPRPGGRCPAFQCAAVWTISQTLFTFCRHLFISDSERFDDL